MWNIKNIYSLDKILLLSVEQTASPTHFQRLHSILDDSPGNFHYTNGGAHIPLKPEILCRWVLAFDVDLNASMIL